MVNVLIHFGIEELLGTDLSRTSSLAAPLGDSLLLKGITGFSSRCRLCSIFPSMLW